MGLLFFLLTQLALAQPPDGGTVPDAGVVAPARSFDPRWSHVTMPRTGAPSSIGQPGSGCVQGAVALSLRGLGYVVAHPERHREYGHPSLIAYIHALVAVARRQKLGLVVIGDLGQPRGGPTPTGHRSHQNGLDVDIWYASPSPALSPGKEPLPPAPSVVDMRTSKMLPAWNKKVVKLVEAAAANPAVDRIFVHPAVKRALCQDKGARGPWLARLRPWWGHQDHFHVRLVCPVDSPDCVQPQPLPDGDGCAQVAWWFSEDAHTTAKKRGPPGERAPVMPEKCEALVE
jgi:penicillin-insensitive murein endopeptidase